MSYTAYSAYAYGRSVNDLLEALVGNLKLLTVHSNLFTMEASELNFVLVQQIVTGLFLLINSLDDEEQEEELVINQFMQNSELYRNIQQSKLYLPLRLENYVEEVVPSYDDITFKSHFRMRRSTFINLLYILTPSILRQSIKGRNRISPMKQLLICIWKMATPDSYRSICEKFNVGRATALRCIRNVTRAIYYNAPKFIKWPDSCNVHQVGGGFAAISGFPNIIGAIDGTHINITAPSKDPEAYVNRKGHHSIQLQAVCDNEGRFTHCYAGHVGSVHDQRVFRLSPIYDYLNDTNKFPQETHILGDSAYSLHVHVMTPFRDNGHLTTEQKNYNYCHSSSRMIIERSFGLLKGRFRSLLTVLDMHRTDLIAEYIVACCVLHNICLMHNDELDETVLIGEDADNTNHNPSLPVVESHESREKRNYICANLPMRTI